MGHRDGSVRLHRRHVPVLRRSPRDRSAFACRCLHFRVPAAPGSAARWSNEIAGENFTRALVQESKARTTPKTRGRFAMTRQEFLPSLEKSLGTKIQNKTEFRGETTYTIAPGDLREIAKFCRDELSFDYLIDITS